MVGARLATLDTKELESFSYRSGGNRHYWRSRLNNPSSGQSGGMGSKMIYSQWFLGVPVITTLGVGMLQVVTSMVVPPSGIVVNSLTFTNAPTPTIIQDREIKAKNKILAQWSASIVSDGEEVCHGSGSWNYPSGSAAIPIEFDEWVGEEGCWNSLPVNVTLQACAKYEWGDGEDTEACSFGFRKEE